MVKRDLARTSILFVSDDGVADFHAAGRRTYITEPLRIGVSLVEAKEIVRHTDVNITMKYTHIGLDDRSKAVSTLRVPPSLHHNPELPKEGSATSGEGSLQMRCIYCSAEGLSETSADKEEPLDDINPGQGQGYVAACHQVALLSKVEATGRQSNFSYKAYSLGTEQFGDASRPVLDRQCHVVQHRHEMGSGCRSNRSRL